MEVSTGVKVLLLSLVLALVALIVVSMSVTQIDNYEMGFQFDRVTGKIETIDHKGWVVRLPIRYSVHTIDLRPYQIQIAANNRVLNAKLVRFKPEGLQTFVEWHGRSAGDNTLWLLEILKCYAFDSVGGADCPFIEIIQVISPNKSILEGNGDSSEN